MMFNYEFLTSKYANYFEQTLNFNLNEFIHNIPLNPQVDSYWCISSLSTSVMSELKEDIILWQQRVRQDACRLLMCKKCMKPTKYKATLVMHRNQIESWASES